LVEDNDINQFVARGLLGQLGIAPETAKNGRDALALLEKSDFDLVLMDCQMPEMDGFEATRRIRSPNAPDRYRNVPVIALTASALEDDVDRCLAAGMNGHLAKPFTPAKLQQALLQFLPPRCVQRDVG
jgi:CheY-like chemotaxis protein